MQLEIFHYILPIYQIYFPLALHLVLLNHLSPSNYLIIHFRGTAKTSFPCSNANSAVIKLPLLFGASVTTIPELSPLIILFLLGKFIGSGGSSISYSVITAPPPFTISKNSFLFSSG